MEERIEDYIKRIESIIQTLSEHIEFEDYDEDVLKEASEDKEALEKLLKRYHYLEYEAGIKINQEIDKIKVDLYKDYIPISVIENEIDKLGNMLQETME